MALTGDVRRWLVDDVYEQMMKVINDRQRVRRPYFLLVHTMEGAGVNLQAKDTKEVATENKRVLNTRIIVMKKPPPVPMLGTHLWYVNNKQGRAICLYVLPHDKPIDPGVAMGKGSKLVFDSVLKADAPVVYN